MQMRTRGFAHFVIARFPDCLGAYDRRCPFTKHGQLEYHVETIERRRTIGSARAALQDGHFQGSLYRTLRAWGIGSRGSVLNPFPRFVDALHEKAADIEELDGLTIDGRDLDVRKIGERLAELIQSLDIVENKARIVPGSKAMHHILPDLVVPIDRQYTQNFFEWANPRFQSYPEQCFLEAFVTFATIARACNPVQYVGRGGWYSSRTKVIDNAIVGLWCLAKEKLDQKKETRPSDCSG